MELYGDFETFLLDNRDRVFRFWVFKRMFTPLEMAEKYIDESQFESTHCTLGIIRECIMLNDGDYLLGFQTVYEDCEDDDTDEPRCIDYYKLSEIRLGFYQYDQPTLEKELTE